MRCRSGVRVFALALAATLAGRTWGVQGLLLPLTIRSGSMAPTLLGPHRQVVCAECGHRFAQGTDNPNDAPAATCPNCGSPGNPLATLPEVAGDRVLLDRGAWRIFPIQRWDVVALRDPRSARRILVKRVVGLPGESIQIRHGEVYVNGRIQPKPMPRQRAMAILVHDADQTSPSAPPEAPGWRPEGTGTPWGSVDGRFAHPERPGQETVDWLVYHHAVHVGCQWVPRAVTDECVYNASQPRRAESASEVADLLVAFHLVRVFGQGQLIVRAGRAGNRFEVWLEPSKSRYQVRQGGHAIPTAEGPLPETDGPMEVEVSLFDSELTLALAGRVVAQVPFDPDSTTQPSDRPFALGAKGLGVEVRHLRVYRDAYYTRPIGPAARWGLDRPVLLGDDEYFVLGDNSPLSEDSRTWPSGPAVKTDLVVGRPLAVFLSTRPVDVGRWQIQVPDLARMRYIR